MTTGECVHVIEYSAYTEALALAEWLAKAAANIQLAFDYGGNMEADREGVPYIKGIAALDEALQAFNAAKGGDNG
jgi:hypothetical protein